MDRFEPFDQPYRRTPLWGPRFLTRRNLAYGSEDKKHSSSSNPDEIIDSFLTHQKDWFDPPYYSYRTLLDFLRDAQFADLTTNVNPAERHILLDDRRDPADYRDWSKYVSPPEGENQSSNLLNERELYIKLRENV
jgi:hypothetical protein